MHIHMYNQHGDEENLYVRKKKLHQHYPENINTTILLHIKQLHDTFITTTLNNSADARAEDDVDANSRVQPCKPTNN